MGQVPSVSIPVYQLVLLLEHAQDTPRADFPPARWGLLVSSSELPVDLGARLCSKPSSSAVRWNGSLEDIGHPYFPLPLLGT